MQKLSGTAKSPCTASRTACNSASVGVKSVLPLLHPAMACESSANCERELENRCAVERSTAIHSASYFNICNGQGVGR
eukprot:scaffold62145_cov41-Tisochrysis_lutea.AAC.2